MAYKQLALIFFVVILTAASAGAQQDAATVTGEVTDPTGAVVPGATVTVTNVGTGIALTTVTNDSGVYTLPGLRPGDYTVVIELQGFSRFARTGLTLQVAQVVRIDARLQTGNVTEAVEVAAATPLLQATNSSRGSVIDERKIVDLPLNGRDYNQLALLSPGVLPGTPRLASVNFKGVLNVNGNRTFNNVFLLDGVDNISYSNSFRGENVQLVQPSIEALQEFKIQTNAYSAEYGRSSGAVINATIKSGTNRLRGSVYEFMRNDALDANNFFSERLGAPKPERKRDQFGGAAGGPIVRNRTFWFADYEGLRDQEGIPRVRLVPTAAEKAGLFSTAVFDPFTAGRAEFARNAQGQWVIPRRSVGSGCRADHRARPRPERAGDEHLRLDASHRHAPGSVRRARRPPARVYGQRIRALQLRRHQYLPAVAAARSCRRLVQRRVRLEPEPVAGTRHRRHVDRFVHARRRIPFRVGPRQLLHESAKRRHRRGRPVRHSQRPQRSGDRRRPAEDEHPGLRRRRAAHLDAAVPDAAIVEPARELHDEPQRAHAEVRVRVPARPDADQRPQRHHRAHELRGSLHRTRRRRSPGRPPVAAGAHQLHGDGPGAGHAVLFPAGRLARHASGSR